MSELRQDPASGEWVIIASERSGRPHVKKSRGSKKICPFCDPETSGNWPPSLAYYQNGKWQILVIPNKYPALTVGRVAVKEKGSAVHRAMTGHGLHELLVTRDHKKSFPHLSSEMARHVFEAFADRFRAVEEDPDIAYLSAYGNWGPAAGASLPHPHYQLLALPVVPADVERSLLGSRRYSRETGKCVHCEAIKAERRAKVRVVAENAHAIAFAPFASWNAYEVKIYPKRHISHFEVSSKEDLAAAAELLQLVLRRMEARLKSPDNNFFIHSAPFKQKKMNQGYHWHIEVVPKLSVAAGFELSTGMDINAVAPETAAKKLR